ncbi:DNA repair protein, partial [Stagonosporopsis vannaccii]
PAQLLARIKQLELDSARDQRAAAALATKLQTKAGEADTLRRRHDADRRRHERQLADQQHVHADELARLRAEIETLRREKDQAATNTMFHQHDVRDAGMAPRARRPTTARPKAATTGSPAATPRKTRGPLGDGFDDDDVVMASPSRTRDRQKTATPSLAGKRKRNVGDPSPIPLQLSEPRSQAREDHVESIGADAHMGAALLDYFHKEDGRFDLLHRLLAHVSPNGTDRVLDALAQHSFPSDPSQRLSSIFYNALAAKAFSDVHALALDICSAICHLWAQCLAERYYGPVNTLLDALHFVLACGRCETACAIKARFVPLMIDSIDLVANPLSKAARLGRDAVNALYASGHREITAQIDVLECLDILHLIATSCVGLDGTESAELWESIPSDFAVMLLNKEQPIAQIAIMLRILSTSALPTSIGPIASSASQPDSQAHREDALIGRLTNLLTEVPAITPDPSAPPETLSDTDMLTLRLRVINLLATLSTPRYGSTRLAQNKICIGRLLKHLDILLSLLYKRPLASTQAATIASINATMRLIYHIVTSNPGFDVKSKLVNTLGGQHAYLVSLTRLAFSEALVLEAGIEDDVVDMAHAVLDEGLSLEEGEAFADVFSTGVSVV